MATKGTASVEVEFECRMLNFENLEKEVFLIVEIWSVVCRMSNAESPFHCAWDGRTSTGSSSSGSRTDKST